MSISKYTPNEYQAWIQTSNRRHLLVEGSDDKRMFERLMEGFLGNNWRERFEIDIDTAQGLVSDDDCDAEPMGNREKVELICERIINADYSEKLVGFVDREYRGFRFDSGIFDDLDRHNIVGRLVWSRGHSIENYFFDFPTLRNPMGDLSVTSYYYEAIGLFEELLPEAITLACATSLTAYEFENAVAIKSSIDWNILEIDQNSIGINLIKWKEKLTNRLRLTEQASDNIISGFDRWYDIVSDAEFAIIRWLCHGHIGLAFVWAVFARCVYEVCRNPDPRKRESEPSRVLRADEKLRINACASSWVRRSAAGECDYPRDVFTLLGL